MGASPLASRRNLEPAQTRAAFKGRSLLLPAVPDPAGKRGGGDPGCGVGGWIFKLHLFCFNLLPAAEPRAVLSCEDGTSGASSSLRIAHPRGPTPSPSSLAQRGFWQDGHFKCSSVALVFLLALRGAQMLKNEF